MHFLKRFVTLSIVAVVVFYILSLIFPNYVVFGNLAVSYPQAIVVTAIVFGFIVSAADELSGHYHFEANVRIFFYWLVNAVTLWIIARTPISERVGFGLPAFWVALVLGLLFYFVNQAVWERKTAKKRR